MAWALLDSTTAGFADGNAGHAITYPGGQPASGDLLILCVASDTTVSTPSGWTLAVSDVVNQGDYLFYRLAGGGEASSVTVTTNGDFPTVAVYLRYSGARPTGTLDVTAAARANNSDSFTSPAVSPSALATTGELSILVACNQEATSTAPTGASATSEYAVVADTGLTGSGALGIQAYVAVNTNSSGSQSPAVTWATSQFLNRTALFAAFLSPSTVDAAVTVPAPMAATAAAPAPTVSAHATVTVPAPMVATAALPAPIVPLAQPVRGNVAGSARRATTLTAAAASRGGPHRG